MNVLASQDLGSITYTVNIRPGGWHFPQVRLASIRGYKPIVFDCRPTTLMGGTLLLPSMSLNCRTYAGPVLIRRGARAIAY